MALLDGSYSFDVAKEDPIEEEEEEKLHFSGKDTKPTALG
ncbi:hypothetical protein PC114_g27023 [Phytophthora cactorum]|uniref:Uncharacterized protein n=1 Tax=Phytophthora cactorum TaxID=29920 RepID=A0A8T1ADP6_9STRA|nr:hypothetical protein PC114_g27023 [Phytophthora cactorum]KAG2878227.1 hypothetical protein PC117_g26961 [Phytophthora cactorum]KAG2968763.1 hypothetical protein PC120_g26779 [Phytophthora cactorum]KAG3122778.1 hypothetical protein C6341_g26823 [Phytophthora cactorum]KAG3130528.1 hypothetical protein PC128_g26718 [Phytophthora cactorum]